MKTSLLFLSGLLLLVRCQPAGEKFLTAAVINQGFEVGVNESVKINASKATNKAQGSGILTFTKLEESRCPANAMCIRQGAAVTTFNISTGTTSKAQTVRLFIGDFMANDPRGKKNQLADTVEVHFANKAKGWLILKNVAPYPGTSENKAKAIIMIKMH